MAWPNKVYVATKAKGVYYTANFGAPTDAQPTWAAVNTGLASLAIENMQCDPDNPEYRQYVCAAGVVYRREGGGDWTAILSTAEARVLTGHDEGAPVWVCCDPATPGKVWVLHTVSGISGYFNQYAIASLDNGTTWPICYGIHGINAYAAGSISAYGDYIYVFTNSALQQRVYYSTNGGASWAAILFGGSTIDGRVWIHPYAPQLAFAYGFESGGKVFLIDSAAGTATEILTATGGWASAYPSGAMWFDPDDADHMRYAGTNVLYITQDGWDTYTTNSDVTGALGIFAPSVDPGDTDKMILGQGTVAGIQQVVAMDGEGAAAVVGRSGTNWNTAPYTDAIPSDSGGVADDGVWAIQEAITEGPTAPPGSTITPPDTGTPITLGGDAYVQAVTMPDYTGDERGEPLPGDRGAWDVETQAHGELHASDIAHGVSRYHLPTEDASEGDAPIFDGDLWVPRNVATQEELDDHAADPAAHHDPVTLGAGNDAEMATLSGQELTIVLKDHDHSGDAGDGGQLALDDMSSGAATNGQVPTADGEGGITWGEGGGGDGNALKLIWMGW